VNLGSQGNDAPLLATRVELELLDAMLTVTMAHARKSQITLQSVCANQNTKELVARKKPLKTSWMNI